MIESPTLDLTEAPSDDALERLSEALDLALDPPPIEEHRGTLGDAVSRIYYRTIGPQRRGTHACLRCGHHWNPYHSTIAKGGPRCCPLCNSSYWNVPPQLDRARRPEMTDWDLERMRLRELYAEQARMRKARQLTREARAIGFEVVERQTRKRVRMAAPPAVDKVKRRIAKLEQRVRSFAGRLVVADVPSQSTNPIDIVAKDPVANIHVALDADYLRRRAYGPTVPPPPGWRIAEMSLATTPTQQLTGSARQSARVARRWEEWRVPRA